jgi:myosin heavy subunit
MVELGFTKAQQENIWKTVATILHIGNIEFKPGANDTSKIDNEERKKTKK